MNKNWNLTSLGQFVDQEVGMTGTENRNIFKAEYENFKKEILIQRAVQEKEIDPVGD